MSKKITKNEFIKRANRVHNNKYSYCFSNYINTQIKIVIKCFKHGLFEQKPSRHLRKQGCPKCSKNYKLNINTFIEKANKIHNNKYDYSSSVYINCSTKIKIICPKHNTFEQIAQDHLNGHGCRKCGGHIVFSTMDFIEKSNIIHLFKYNYNLVNYINHDSKVKIICFEHGLFEQSAGTHLNGSGCQKCGGTQKLTVDNFKIRAEKIHKNKYNYELVTHFQNNRSKIHIICPIHGKFEQILSSHLSGNGCSCCQKKISTSEIEWLDYLNISSVYRHKSIKINNKRYNVDAFNPETNTIYEFYGDFWHGNPNVFNGELINKVKKMSFKNIYEKTKNRENELKSAKYNIIFIWENDWKNFKKDLNEKNNNFYTGS